MHSLAAELMVGMFVFQVVGASESILMSGFLTGAGGASMPIVHVKTAAETHVLVAHCLTTFEYLGFGGGCGWTPAGM